MKARTNRLVLAGLFVLAGCSAAPSDREGVASLGEALHEAAPLTATWTVTAQSWNDSGVIGPQTTTLPVQVRFQQEAGVWHAYVDSFTADLGGGMQGTLQAGKIASGTIDGDAASVTLPLHVTSPLASFDVTVPLSTSTTIDPPNVPAQTGQPYNGKNVAACGSGVGSKILLLGRGVTIYLRLAGPITAWP
jgi:hypothetical protein